MKTQKQMFRDAQDRSAGINNHFLDMVNDEYNHLTNADLEKLIQRFPDRWLRFKGLLGKLKD